MGRSAPRSGGGGLAAVNFLGRRTEEELTQIQYADSNLILR